MLTEQQKEEYVGQLRAFMHADVDGAVALIEARHKATGEPVLLACIVREVSIPPRIMGGMPTIGEQIVPIFQFVDPHAPNPYESLDKDLAEVPESPIALADATERLRIARDAASEG